MNLHTGGNLGKNSTMIKENIGLEHTICWWNYYVELSGDVTLLNYKECSLITKGGNYIY